MPSCCVVGCNNHTGSPPGISLHRFPKDDSLAEQWVAAVKRDNLPDSFRTTSFVCASHFAEESFQADFKARVLGTPSRRMLVHGAVPCVFSHAEPPAKRQPNKLQAAKDSEAEVSAIFHHFQITPVCSAKRREAFRNLTG